MSRVWRWIHLFVACVLLAGLLPVRTLPAVIASEAVVATSARPASPPAPPAPPIPSNTTTFSYRIFVPFLQSPGQLLGSVEQTLAADQTTTLTLLDGRVRVTFAPVGEGRVIQATLAARADAPLTTPGMGRAGPVLDVQLIDQVHPGVEVRLPPVVTQLPRRPFYPVTSQVIPSVVLELQYSDDDIWGLDERSLGLYKRRSATDPWQRVPSAVFPDQNRLMAHIETGGEYALLGELQVAQLSQTSLRLALDPDDNDGYAFWPGIGYVREISYNVRLANEIQQRLQAAGCPVTILITRDTTPFVAESLRAAAIAGFGADVAVTLAFNTYLGVPWGGSGDGGPVAFARAGSPNDVTLAQRLLNGVRDYTGRRSTRPVLIPPPHPEFNNLPATYAHLEALFLDHVIDWPIINTSFNLVVDGVYAALADELSQRGLLCTPPGGSTPTPPPLPPRPSPEQLQRLRDLGYQHYQRYGMDPVSLSTGNHVLQRPLARIPGRGGLDVDLTLVYNSQDPRCDIVGCGWNFPYNMRLQRYSDESVAVVYPDGRTMLYEWTGSGYRPPAGGYDRLERREDFWFLTSQDGEQIWQFQETVTGLGILVAWRDRRGNTLTFTHDLSGQDAWQRGEAVPRPPLTAITDATGRVIRVENDADGRIRAFVLPDGRRFDLEYDSRGDLVAIADANTPTRGVYRFEYDERHRVIRQWDAEGILYLVNEYDDRDRVVRQFDASGTVSSASYDPLARTTIFTDNLGFRHVYVYDELYRVIAETDSLNRTSRTVYDNQYNIVASTDARGHTIRASYDQRGNLIALHEPVPDPVAACREHAYTTDTTVWEYNGSGANANLPSAMIDALGRRWEYRYDDEGNLVQIIAPIGVTSAQFDEWGQLTALTDAAGRVTRYFYDTHGNLIRIVDPLNGVVTMTYDLTGRQLSVTDANNRTVYFAYNGNDLVTRITDAKGATTLFDYDRNGLLISLTDRHGVTRRFSYDENLKLIGELDHPHGAWATYAYDRLYRLIRSTDRNGHSTEYRYDPAGQLREVIDPTGAITRFDYDETGNVTAITDPLGGVQTIAYDAVGRPVVASDADGSSVTYCYDAEDRLVRMVGPRPGEFYTFAYDAMDRLVAATNALNATVRIEYDVVGNQVAQIDPLGNRTELQYDLLDRLVAVIAPPLTDGTRPTARLSYDAVGNLTSITTPRGFTTQFIYDANDNLVQENDPLGAVTRYLYDAEDRPIAVIDPNGNTSRAVYDPVGNLVAITNGAGETLQFVYDAAYNLIEAIDPLGRATRYDYNERNELVRMTDPLGNATTYLRDAAGRVSAMVDAAGRHTEYVYDPVGRLLAVIDPLRGRTSYEYNEGGDLIAIRDANGNTSRFSFDVIGRLTGEIDPLGQQWRYEYDAANRLVKRVDALGRSTFYDYDSNSRLTGIRYSVPPTVQSPVTIAYDLDGNETARCTDLGCVRHAYNPLGLPVETIDWAGRAVRRSFDPAGNLVELIYPDGRPVRYDYDAAHRLTSITLPNRQTSVIARDGAGSVQQISHPNGIRSNFSYDAAGRLTAIDHRRAGAAEPHTAFAYTLDRTGNRVAVSETRAAFDGSNRQVNFTRGYAYDDNNRLIQATSNLGSDTRYTFDAAGNRLSETGSRLKPDPDLPQLPAKPAAIDQRYRYNAANQLIADGDTTIHYNANGERQREERRLPDGRLVITDYRFDLEGRLTGVTIQTGGVVQMEASYTYDGYGRRASKTVRYPQTSLPPEVTEYIYDGLDIIGSEVRQGQRVETSAYFLMESPLVALRRPFAMERRDTGATYWFETDGLDSIVAVTDANGNLAGQMLYTEYGQHLAGDPALQRFTFAAQAYDAETGFLHFYARLYDPARGVWLSPDPYRGDIAMPVTLHRYGYVGNNPTNWVDAWGYDRRSVSHMPVEEQGSGLSSTIILGDPFISIDQKQETPKYYIPFEGEAYVFIDRDGAMGLGHVAWGFRKYGKGKEGKSCYVYGSTDNLSGLPFSLAGQKDFWVKGDKAEECHDYNTMINAMKGKYEHGKKIKVRSVNVARAMFKIFSIRNKPYLLSGSNCMNDTYDILSAYNARLPNPNDMWNWCPNDFYDNIAGEEIAELGSSSRKPCHERFFEKIQNWTNDQLRSIQNWTNDQLRSIQNWTNDQLRSIQNWTNDPMRQFQNWFNNWQQRLPMPRLN